MNGDSLRFNSVNNIDLMKYIIIGFILLVTGLINTCQAQDTYQSLALLMPPDDMGGEWHAVGPAEYAEGQDLFLLINGGAEIYHEYGFDKALYQTYVADNGKSIHLEIYEMSEPSSAYGMYTFKSGHEGKAVALGCQGVLESYYLNFWADRYLITVVGMDSSDTVLKGIFKIARYINDRLTCQVLPPALIRLIPAEDLVFNGITYVKGNQGLFNQYLFDRKNIFGLREGVIGKYSDHTLMLFQYASDEEALHWYLNAKEKLKNSGIFTEFTDQKDHFEMRSDLSDKIIVKHYRKWILIVIGSEQVITGSDLDQIQQNLGS